MSDDGGETSRRRRQRGAATATSPGGAPPKSGDILWEIFLRLPPLPPLPSSLPRVSLVCKRWRRLAADPDFLLRFRSHHRKAPLLGLFKEYGGCVSFAPVLDAPDRVPRHRLSMRIDYGGAAETYPCHGMLLGCRHGRALVLDPRRRELLVCDPITGDQRRVALPPKFRTLDIARGAVLCADGDEGHVHGGCHSSPFKVVLVQILYEKEGGGDHRGRAGARVYSSETGMWSDLISAPEKCRSSFVDFHRPSALVGGSLYWWLRSSYDNMEILEFYVGRQSVSVIDGPPIQKHDIHCSQIIQGEDGGVGLAVLSYRGLQMWDWKVDFGGEVATWVPRKTVNLELVPNMRSTETEIVGYVEDDDAILIKFNKNVFIVQLKSMQPKKLCESIVTHQYHPFTSFYSLGKFGRCGGLTSMPSTAAPPIQTPEQEAPSPPAGKKHKRAR